MAREILNIVVAGIKWGEKWLLIKRKKGDYQNKWALVGGKLEKNEELKEAILREIKEETGLNVSWQGIKGVINERLIEEHKEGNIRHFMIIVGQTTTENGNLLFTEEGELKWFTFDEVRSMKDSIIPSDYYMITKLLQEEKDVKTTEIEMVQNHDLLTIKKLVEY